MKAVQKRWDKWNFQWIPAFAGMTFVQFVS